MTIYLGPVGNLQALPYMGRGIGASLDLGAATQRALGGARTVDYVGTPRRVYTLERKYLTPFEVSVIEALALGAYGPGPLVLVEPWRRNLLTANQSSATDVLGDTTGFFASSPTTIVTTTAQAYAGTRSLAWAVTAVNQNVGTGSQAIATADPLTATPVRVGVRYGASLRGRLLSSTGTLRPLLRWYDSAGVFISDSAGTAAAMSTSAWTRCSATAVAPAGAALMRVLVNNTVFGAATTFYMDDWIVEETTDASYPTSVPESVMGTGVPRVAFTDLSDSYPISDYHDVGFTLQEVG